MRNEIPYEVPVSEFGVLGGVLFDCCECTWYFFTRICGYFADDLADQESIVEVIGDVWWQSDVSFLVLLAWVGREVPVFEIMLDETSHAYISWGKCILGNKN